MACDESIVKPPASKQATPTDSNRRQPPRDYGPRADRQKTRLMWTVEEMGLEGFVAKVGLGLCFVGGGRRGE